MKFLVGEMPEKSYDCPFLIGRNCYCKLSEDDCTLFHMNYNDEIYKQGKCSCFVDIKEILEEFLK